jgi:putative FmdB family regulatory protein
MPIYEYACRQCGHRFELLILKTSPAAACPACQATDPEQLISMVAMSSESIRQANISSARKKAVAISKDKQYEEAKEIREHYGDHH